MSRMKKQMKAALLCGMLGCLCYGAGDWLMMYGNPAYHGTLSWLTEGVAAIPQGRYNLAMALAFPGIFLYGIALFTVEGYIKDGKQRRVYHYLNAFDLLPNSFSIAKKWNISDHDRRAQDGSLVYDRVDVSEDRIRCLKAIESFFLPGWKTLFGFACGTCRTGK